MPKDVYLTVRVSPSLKQASKDAALLENRSITNYVETHLAADCQSKGGLKK